MIDPSAISAAKHTVSARMGGKSKRVGSTPAADLAKQLLQELAKEGKA